MLYNFQTIILQLYTDEKLRRLFFENPEEALRSRNLTVREQEALKGITKDELALFAKSLAKKRRKMAERTLRQNPGTAISSGFYRNGPVLFLKNGGVTAENMSAGAYEVFRHITGKINVKTLMRAFLTAKKYGVGDCVILLKIVWKNNLWGRAAIHL